MTRDFHTLYARRIDRQYRQWLAMKARERINGL